MVDCLVASNRSIKTGILNQLGVLLSLNTFVEGGQCWCGSPWCPRGLCALLSKGASRSQVGSCSSSQRLCVPGKKTGLGARGSLLMSLPQPRKELSQKASPSAFASCWPERTHLAIQPPGSSGKCFSSGPVATCWD